MSKSKAKSQKSKKPEGSQYLIVPEFLFEVKDLTYKEIFLISRIINYQNQYGCYASNEHLAKNLYYDTRDLRRAIKKLEAKGYVKRIASKLNDPSRTIEVGTNLPDHWIVRSGQNTPTYSGQNTPTYSGQNTPPNKELINNKYSFKEDSYWNTEEIINPNPDHEPRTTIEIIDDLKGIISDDVLQKAYDQGITHADIARRKRELNGQDVSKYFLINGLIKKS